MSLKADLSMQASAALPSSGGPAPLRPISFKDPEITVDRRADGTIYLRPSDLDIGYPVRLTDSLYRWAKSAPDRVFNAGRSVRNDAGLALGYALLQGITAVMLGLGGLDIKAYLL